MPFTFKLSQRLARIRCQGSVARAVAPATVRAPRWRLPPRCTPPTTHHASCRFVSSEATGAQHQ